MSKNKINITYRDMKNPICSNSIALPLDPVKMISP